MPFWAWPTALSLDAPTVAVVWQALFATSYNVTLAPIFPIILGLCVWLIYAGDRLLDGLELDLNKEHTYRHALYVRYRQPFTLVWSITFLITSILAFTLLPNEGIILGAGLCGAVGLYMLGTHLFKALTLSKEMLIGLVFATAASLPVWTERASVNLLLSALLFAVLAGLNCLLIATWEVEIDAAQRQRSSLQVVPKLAQVIGPLLFCLSLVSLVAELVLPSPLMLSVSLSALLMWALKSCDRLGDETRRVLADAALLTPLLFLAFI